MKEVKDGKQPTKQEENNMERKLYTAEEFEEMGEEKAFEAYKEVAGDILSNPTTEELFILSKYREMLHDMGIDYEEILQFENDYLLDAY